MKRVILPLRISLDPQFCHIKRMSKHCCPRDWTLLLSFLCLNIFLAGSRLPGTFPSLSCVLDLFSGFILSSFLLKGLPLGTNICITNLSQVFLLLPISTESDPFPYHFSLLIHILYNIGLRDHYQKHAPIVPGPQGEMVHHLRTSPLKWPRQMDTWGAEGLTTMLAPLIWTTRVSSLPLTVGSPACHIVVKHDMNNYLLLHKQAPRSWRSPLPPLTHTAVLSSSGQVLLHGSSIPA